MRDAGIQTAPHALLTARGENPDAALVVSLPASGSVDSCPDIGTVSGGMDQRICEDQGDETHLGVSAPFVTLLP